MEKKVNLNIFFNYRTYSPRFKLLLEDVFYKKMHDEKLSSSDAMQQVMKFCNDVNSIEYMELETNILSRYSKQDKIIFINNVSVDKLIDEHKDLDEEALIKNILGKQTQNILLDDNRENYEVTFEDVLNRNGYVAPRKLSDMQASEKSNESDELSVVDDILTQKIAKKSEIRPSFEEHSNITVTNEDKRFLPSDETIQIADVQNELREKIENQKVSFKNFSPDEEYESDTLEDSSEYAKVGVLSRRLNIDEPEDNFELLDCIKRKDDTSSNFSDFVTKNNYSEDMLEDEEDYNKGKNNILDSVKSKVSNFADKIKTSIASKVKHEDEEYEDSAIDDLYSKKDSNSSELEIKSDYASVNDSFTAASDTFEIKESPKYEDLTSTSKFVDDGYQDMQMSLEDDIQDSDVILDEKFDNIISAIMKEKEKEIEEDEMLSYVENYDKENESDHLNSVYDTFAQELETVESVRKRRRNR